MTDEQMALLARLTDYLAGECGAEEQAAVDRLLCESSVAAATLDELRLVMHAVPVLADSDRVDDIGRNVRAAIERTEQRRALPATRRLWTMFAASGVVAVVLVGLLAISPEILTRPLSVHTYHTARGQLATIQLDDSSVMTLAPSTTAEVRGTSVVLYGEAYFQIAPHSSRPFTVRTRSASVQVLGTRFVVRQYPTDAVSRVAVEDGKVAMRLTSPHRAVAMHVLTAQTLGRATDSTVSVTTGIVIEDYTAWANGRLVFDDMPMHDVVADLARAYGVEIRLADSVLAARKVSLTVSPNTQSLSAVLKLLAPIVDARVTPVGRAFLIVPGQAIPESGRRILSPRQETQYGR